MKMLTIQIDEEVYQKLGDLAKPFFETSPNDVIRRLLGLPRLPMVPSHPPQAMVNTQNIINLNQASPTVHQAFLTFLLDKFQNTSGNFSTSHIIPFMQKFNLVTPSGSFWNPWMEEPYQGEKNGSNSCVRTIEHFRQCRKFGCWSGRDSKIDCKVVSCNYHPDNPQVKTNKCDLRKGVIWKRLTSDSPWSYGNDYIEVVNQQLLSAKPIPIEPLLKVFYPNENFGKPLINKFVQDFHLNSKEMIFFRSSL